MNGLGKSIKFVYRIQVSFFHANSFSITAKRRFYAIMKTAIENEVL